jgi:hypothetical protein
VQPNAVDVQEAASGRIVTLRFLCEISIDQSHFSERPNYDRRSYR